MTSVRAWGPAVLGIGMVLIAVLPGFLVASLAVRIRMEFPLSDAMLGLAVGISYGVAALSSPMAGRLVDRIGPKRGMLAGGALAAASSLGIALLVHSALGLIALLSLAGFANALAGPGASSLVSRTVRPASQGTAFGIQQAGAPAGALLAGLALPLVAAPLGWRAAFLVAAVLAGAVLAGVSRLAVGAGTPAHTGRRRTRGRWLGDAQLVAVAAVLASGSAAGMLTFLVVFSVEAGLAEGLAGALLAASSLVAGATRIGLGALADRRPSITLIHVSLLVALGAVGFLLLATAQPPAIVAGALVIGGLGWGWTGLAILLLIRANPQAPGATVGIMLVGIFAGAGAGPLLLGLLAEATSFRLVWLFGTLLMLAAAAVLVGAARLEASEASRPRAIRSL